MPLRDVTENLAKKFCGDNVDTEFDVSVSTQYESVCKTCGAYESWWDHQLPEEDPQLPILDWHATHGQMHDDQAVEKGKGSKCEMIDKILADIKEEI